MNNLIYIGCPYQHDDIAVMEQRFQKVSKKAAELMSAGKQIFSPISMCHPMAQYGLPRGWEFWAEFDKQFLEMCSELYVLKLDGWEKSTGLRAEIKIAIELGIKIVYLEDE